jgi:carotenoid cleavage dioxygenase
MAAAALPRPGFARAVREDSWAEAFHAALDDHPWLRGYQTAGADSFSADATISGRWPRELAGTLYRNGPARHEFGDFRYHHWFDGDGMVQAFRMSPGGVSHQAKLVQTRKLTAEQSAGRPLYPGFDTPVANPAPVTGPDSVNVANISVLPHHGKLLALWEAGSPWEIDPDSLETRGLYQFSDETRGVPFSAHPRVEPDGQLWNFGYLSSARLIVLWHIDRNGKVVKMGKIPCDPISMPHDFIVTHRHIVLMMPPLHYDPTGARTFLEAHRWQPDQATRVLVVDKNDFSQHRWVELPSQWVFHFGNGWEDEAGVIRFDGARASDPSAMLSAFRDVMRGAITPFSGSYPYLYRIDTRTGTASETPLLDQAVGTEFPAIDPRLSGHRYRQLVTLSRSSAGAPTASELNEVSVLDVESGQRRFWPYPDGQLPEEHLWIPAPGSKPETQGWVIGTAHDWQRGVTLLNVFNGKAVDAGPVATATLPYALPLGFHGKFVAA